jgi:hypothetical protein
MQKTKSESELKRDMPMSTWRRGFVMSFMGMFPNEQERRLAQDEAAHAIEQYGDRAETVLLKKAQQTRSASRRVVYKLARRIVLGNA